MTKWPSTGEMNYATDKIESGEWQGCLDWGCCLVAALVLFPIAIGVTMKFSEWLDEHPWGSPSSQTS